MRTICEIDFQYAGKYGFCKLFAMANVSVRNV